MQTSKAKLRTANIQPSTGKHSFITCNDNLGRQTPSFHTFAVSFFYVFIAECVTMWLVGLSSPGCVCSQLLAHPCLAAGRAAHGSRRALDAVWTLLSSVNDAVFSTNPNATYTTKKTDSLPEKNSTSTQSCCCRQSFSILCLVDIPLYCQHHRGYVEVVLLLFLLFQHVFLIVLIWICLWR